MRVETVAVARAHEVPEELRARALRANSWNSGSSREMARRVLGLYEELVRTKRDDSTTTRYESAA